MVQVTTSENVDVTATDPGGLFANQTFTVTVPNRAPVAGEPIEDIEVVVGEVAQADVSSNFSDPDGDALSYTATPSDAGVATASVSGSAVTVTGVSLGTANARVTATDPGGLSAVHVFTVTVRLTDRQVLEILYDELGGDGWRNNTNWLTDAPLEEWYGVGTDADGRVDTLHLEENRLAAGIPSELGNLSNLRYLSLDGNSLTGKIPPELGDLSNLEQLHLHYNRLTGGIPPELGNLSNLEVLGLQDNRLTGAIPPELGELSNLRVLHLHYNRLTGGIPPELADLSNLEWLTLNYNRLTGEIPSELGDLSNLEFLYLHYNRLTGEIPRDFLDLSSLRYFYWNDNDGLCAPDTGEFDEWLGGLAWDGPRCD